MADQNANLVRLLGRVLTTVGLLWAALIVLAGMGILSELGMSGAFLAGLGGSIIPPILLLAAGRALRRRARSMEGQAGIPPVPSGTGDSGKRVPTSRVEPTTTPTPVLFPAPGSSPPKTPPKTPPKPAGPVTPSGREGPSGIEEVIAELKGEPPVETKGSTPPAKMPARSTRSKTSQELVDEARKKWGGDKKR